MSYKDFRPSHPYEMHYQDYRSWSVHASPALIERVNILADELSQTSRHRVTNGEVLERALAALDREMEWLEREAIQEAAGTVTPRAPKPTLAEIAKRAAAADPAQ